MKVGLKLFIPCFCALLVSASSCENQDETVTEEEVSEINDGIRAVVTTQFLDDGCEVLLEIQESEEKALLLPIELDERFKIDGAELLITFHSSRIMQSTCQIGRPVVLDMVKLVE